MFKALDYVNYDSLYLGKKKDPPLIPAPASLVNQSCLQICRSPPLTDAAMTNVPAHLAQPLLQVAMENLLKGAVTNIVAAWPLDTLCFREIVPGSYEEIFMDEMGLDLVLFRGLTNRTKTCRMKCLDFRGCKLNTMFTKFIIQMWPLLSLKKSQLSPKKLAAVVAKVAGVSRVVACRLTEEILPRILKDLLTHDMVKSPSFAIKINKGDKLRVKIDNVTLTTNNTFFMDFLISNCLRDITPLVVVVSNITIRSELEIGDQIMDSLGPFIVLRGQDINTLEGICLEQLEEGIFFIVASDITKFLRIRALDLQDCSIYLQQGRTRSRASGRMQVTSAFSSFQNLTRLDISRNCIVGCLGEILDALRTPLSFLSLHGCDLNESDLDALTKSCHATSLRELYLSKLCQISISNSDRIGPAYLIKITQHFPNLTLLNLSQNYIPISSIPQFSYILLSHLQKLKGIDLSCNFSSENLMEIIRSCAKVPTMQWIKVTYILNIMEELGIVEADHNMVVMETKIVSMLKGMCREDIRVKVVRLTYAALFSIIDF